MSKNFKRILSFLLLALMLLSLFAACGKKDDDKDDDSGNDVDDQIQGSKENPNLPPKDYNGHEFTFITDTKYSAYNIEFLVSEGESGEVLDDAIARRNALLEEKYRITIAQITTPDIVTEVRTQVMGGLVEFDAIMGPAYRLATMAQENLLYNLLDIDTFNWDASYWDSNSKDQLMIGNKLYFANCAMDIHSIGFAVFFNKKIVSEWGLTSPYEYMKNNEWTIDNWATMVKSVYKDLDNDGAMTEMDLFGTLSEHHVPRMFLYASGVRATTNDENGYPVVTLMDNADKTVDIYEKVKDVITNATVTYCTACSNVDPNGYDDKYGYIQYLFTQDHYMFYFANDLAVPELADMESEFGIVPFPKYNASQELYQTVYPYHCALLALPSVIEDIERTSAIIEDMNYYSSLTVVPAWYEKLLTVRFVRDDESEGSLKILRENCVYDLGLYYNFGKLRTVLDSDPAKNEISRNYDRYKKSMDADIKKIYKDFGMS